MASMQLVFLFDLNAFNNIQLKTRSDLNKKLLGLRIACLRLLTEFSTKSTNLRWGFKFFDSLGSLTQVMSKFSFPCVSLESFETLENEISVRYERHISYFDALTESVQKNMSLDKSCCKIASGSQTHDQSTTPVKILQLALTQILCEYQWENYDLWSPGTKIKSGSSENSRMKKNYLFFITNVSDTNEDFFKYYGSEFAFIKSSKFINLLLSQSLRGQLLDKCDIRWIWLNTSQGQSFLNSFGVTTLIASALHNLKGCIIPLCVLAQSHCVSKLICSTEKQPGLGNQSSELFVKYRDVHNNSILPFSTLFHQSLSYPFYLNKLYSNNCILCFYNGDEGIPISVVNICKEKCIENSITSKEPDKTKKSVSLTNENSIVENMWSKFIVQFAVSMNVQETAYDTVLCLPDASAKSSTYFKEFIKVLFSDNMKLVLECETKHGIQMPGLLSPLSDASAVIAILHPTAQYMKAEHLQFKNSFMKDEEIRLKEKINEEIQNFGKKIHEETSNGHCHKEFDLHIRPFQMECMETWFEPTSSISSLISNLKIKQKSVSKMELFHKHLKSAVNVHKHAAVLKAVSKTNTLDVEQESELTEAASNLNPTDNSCEMLENYSNMTYDDLKLMLSKIYDYALESSSCLIESAKNILKTASHFFQQKDYSTFKEEVQNFLKEHILINSRKINEKYEVIKDDESASKRIKECQIQAILILELEALLPSSEKSKCVTAVTSFLRTMSFYSGASELNKLLYETLRENYSHNLYSVLLEVGNELDIPIVGEDESSDSSNGIPSSELANESDLFSSVVSSTLSGKSSSSISNRKDSRKLVRHRSDISDTSKSRQVLLPGTSNKKKKSKCGVPKKATRCSPRLASKKEEKLKMGNENSQSVCRNLFPQDDCIRTPKKHKQKTSSFQKNKGLSTPERNQILKASFVADTPSNKQNCSALQRRKSLLKAPENSLKEISESPTIQKTAKDVVNLDILLKLRKNSSSSLNVKHNAGGEKASSSARSMEATPETKRRLSLKLFSKLLTSPTARMGLKKCSKRLFGQTSPQTAGKSCKKLKLSEEP